MTEDANMKKDEERETDYDTEESQKKGDAWQKPMGSRTDDENVEASERDLGDQPSEDSSED